MFTGTMAELLTGNEKMDCVGCSLPVLGPPYLTCHNFHISCVDCHHKLSSSSGNECSECNGLKFYSHPLEEYDRLESRQKIFRATKDCPIVILVPTLMDEKNDITYTEIVDSHEAEFIQEYRLPHCPDCKKCMSTQSVLEHFRYEHGSVPLVPILPGHMIAFTFQPDQVELEHVRLLYVIRLFKPNSVKCEGEERLLYVLCSKSPLLEGTRATSLAFWLASSFNACCVHYTLEFRADSGTIASSMFTGPVLANTENENVILGKAKVEEMGPFFSIKETLVRSLMTEGGGAIVKILVHDELTYG